MGKGKEKESILIFNGGDLSIDYHIQVETELRKELKYVTDSNGTAFTQVGNAFFTGKLLESVFSQEIKNDKVKICKLYEKPTTENIMGLPSAFSVIRKFSEHDNKTGKTVSPWRISEYLGRTKGTKKDLYKNSPQKHQNDHPDILILSEYDQDFRKEKNLWPSCILKEKTLPPTFLRCSHPLICKKNKNKLLHYLLGKSNANSNLVLFTTIDDLRKSDINIRQGLSWESTALDLVAAFNFPKLAHLRKAAFVIVNIGRYGVFVYKNTSKDWQRFSLFYSKKDIEENNDMGFMGSMHGLNTGLMLHVVKIYADELAKTTRRKISFGIVKEGLLLGLVGTSDAFNHGFCFNLTDNKANPKKDLKYLHFPDKALFHNLLKDKHHKNNFAFTFIPDKSPRKGSYSWDIIKKPEEEIKNICHKIVKKGDIAKNLKNIPYSDYEQYVVVGRREIEEGREIKKLITSYTQKVNPKRPLSIAVFGKPGSGKSYGIKKIAASIFKSEETILKFNLSQLQDIKALVEAFHLVRDAAIKGKTVIVFWDEFDTFFENEDFGWVKYFLAPMQDGIFYEGPVAHPLGPSIFIFLSSKYKSLAEINKVIDKIRDDASRGASNGEKASTKLIDFVSRLQGHIEIPGINPLPLDSTSINGVTCELPLRRAIMLRSLLERHCPTIFDKDNKASIDPGLISAFLGIEKYYHGARSMEAIITMSHVDGKSRFNRSCLPADNQLSLHVDVNKFKELIDLEKKH